MLGIHETLIWLATPARWVWDWTPHAHRMIRADQVGLRVRGKRVDVLEPGLHWFIPHLDALYIEEVTRHVRSTDVVVELEEGTVRLDATIAYRIVDPEVWLIQNEDPEDGLMEDFARVIAARTVDYTLEELRDEVADPDAEELTTYVQSNIGPYFGVEVLQAGFRSFALTRDYHMNGGGGIVMDADDDDE